MQSVQFRSAQKMTEEQDEQQYKSLLPSWPKETAPFIS